MCPHALFLQARSHIIYYLLLSTFMASLVHSPLIFFSGLFEHDMIGNFNGTIFNMK